MSEPRFKPCMQDQLMLLPPDIGDLVPEGSLARVVDEFVRSIDRSVLTSLYPGGGAPAHDPLMMLKVLLLSYSSGIYTSRGMERATMENVGFLWICGMRPLDHCTINRFRSERVRPVFEEIFAEFVSMIADMGLVTLDTYFLDGTKMEANANKFTFVWAKSTKRYKEQLRERVHAHLAAIDEMDEAEEALAPESPAEVDSIAIAEAARKVSERIERKKVGKRPRDAEGKALRKAKRELEGDWAERMSRYEEQERILDGRGSYSKTDHDATFMRMKEDTMTNATKPAYNVQAGTEGQFILDVTCHRRPGDTACMIEHLEHASETVGHLPEEIVADAGYGSEQNYAWLEEQGCDAYVKHNEFFRECRNRKWREDPLRPANWEYDAEADEYACPGGRKLKFRRESRTTSELGYESLTRIYEASGCGECPHRKKCFRSKREDAVRILRVNPTLDAFKARASEMLHTERGSTLRKQRSVDVETIFGDIKRNWGFRRFLLRGLEKVDHEMRMVAMGHNIRKLAIAMSV
ncbi:MAG: IS1182 family transposase [Coriobacteriales bacterium]|nr:IS1182 family transposase [Coriobacteriales bacterium]